MAKIKHIQVLQAVGVEDRLFGWLTRDGGNTDGFYQWNGSGWTLLKALDGTDLIYDSAILQGKLYWADGKNPIQVYKPDSDEVCDLVEESPIVQYLIAYQDRLVGAGDARTQSEVEADGGVWPADSNRTRVIFSEALDVDTWPPNNFINADIGTGEVVSGLGVNSINSSTKGAQTQLVVFMPSSVQVNDGALATAEQRLAVASGALGCPGYHSIVNTPFGLVFAAKTTVCLLDQSGKVPEQIGFQIWPQLAAVPVDLQKWEAGIYHDNSLKLSIADENETDENTLEWWLDLRPQIFPQEQNWYGPMTGDKILQYAIFNHELIGAQMLTTAMWKLDVEGVYNSMTDTTTPRDSVMVWPQFKVDNIQKGKLDAYGFRGVTDAGTTVPFVEVVAYDSGASTTSNTFTTGGVAAIYNVTRPLRRSAYDAKVQITHSEDSDIEVHSLYLRLRQIRRQSEKAANAVQT